MVDKTSLLEQAYTYFRRAILNGEFNDGEFYSEALITTTLHLSRTPARGALQKLEAEGYIDIYPSRGFTLHNADKAELKNVFQSIIAYETYCCFHIATRPDRDQLLTILEQIVDEQSYLAQKGNTAAFIEKDNLFHKTIFQSLENDIFTDAYSIYRFKARNHLNRSFSHGDALTQSVEDHVNILKALHSGSTSSIIAILENHHNDFDR